MFRKLRNFFRKEELSEKDHLKNKTLVKFSVISSSASKKDAENKFHYVFKDFIAKYFHISHEFTLEEFEKELVHKKLQHDKRNALVNLIEDIENYRYGNLKKTPSQLKEIISKTKEAIKKL